MKKVLLMFVALLGLATAQAQTAQKPGFYDLKFKTLDGKDFKFSELKGKKVMIVNTASKCGYTPQYAELEEVFEKYKGQNFVILGFPANNFGGQEPGTNAEIGEFCKKNYGVSFQMMEKSSVKGNDMNPVYKWLTSKEMNGVEDNRVSWNFNKFLIDANGKFVAHYDSRISPKDQKIIDFITK